VIVCFGWGWGWVGGGDSDWGLVVGWVLGGLGLVKKIRQDARIFEKRNVFLKNGL
jgi:hypothetical protein